MKNSVRHATRTNAKRQNQSLRSDGKPAVLCDGHKLRGIGLRARCHVQFRLHGGADERRRALGRFGDEFELRVQRRIFAVLDQQPVGVTLDDGENVVQFVRDDGRDVPGGIKFRLVHVSRAARFERRSHFFIDRIQ